MSNYSTDADLLLIRSNILELGVDSWEDKHTEAKVFIDRTIASKWYRTLAGDNNVSFLDVPFDSNNFLNGGEQLRRLSCYKTLQLVYLDLMKEMKEKDGFERYSDKFEKLYEKELEEILSAGLDYDWDLSGVITEEERDQSNKRRLKRA